MRASSATDTIPHTIELLERGIDHGLHVGAQVWVSMGGEVVADVALGEARPAVAMRTDTLMPWFSMTKAVTTVAVARIWEQDGLALDDRVCMHVPEFGQQGKERVTVRHLLTHTAGIRYADKDGGRRSRGGELFSRDWGESLRRVCESPLEKGWVPGAKAGYHPTSSMLVLGELVSRISGKPFPRYVRDDIFRPLEMLDCWIGMPVEAYRGYGERIGVMHDTASASGSPRPMFAISAEDVLARSFPGAGGRGPMRELGRLYEMLLGRGHLGRSRILRSQTVEALSARHRVGMFDHTSGIHVDWGLGFVVDHYSFGRHCSPRTYGHAGGQSSVSFADPEHGLAVAIVMNGMPGPARHHPRQDAVSTAVYVDLGLASPTHPGRSRPYPRHMF